MTTIQREDAIYRSARAQGLNGSPRVRAVSRKYAVDTTAISILLPLHDERRPQYLKLHCGTQIVYGVFDQVAVVPTTSVDGAERLSDGTEISIYGQDRISLIAEAAGIVTLSFIWTL